MQSNPLLFCFTYAGGNKSFFNEIANDLDGISVAAFDYAGHGERHKEPFCNDFDEVADDIFQKMKERLTGTYALFGYSMGCITLVEVLKRILDAGLPLPSNVFLAAHEPLTQSDMRGFTSEELDGWVMERTVRFGGMPEKLMNNRAFWRMYLPLFRADYLMIARYEFEKLDLSSDIPATVFYSETDTPYTKIKLWTNYFQGECEFHKYDGTHFFIRQHHAEMAHIIKEKLEMDHDV